MGDAIFLVRGAASLFESHLFAFNLQFGHGRTMIEDAIGHSLHLSLGVDAGQSAIAFRQQGFFSENLIRVIDSSRGCSFDGRHDT